MKMNLGNRWLWLGVASVALGVLGAVLRTSEEPLPASNHEREDEPSTPMPAGSFSLPVKVSPANPTLQQMIDSGQLNPPPGNTHKMYSMASPFMQGPGTAHSAISSAAEGNRQDQKPIDAGAFTTSPDRGRVKLTSNTRPDIPPANSPAQTSDRSIEFDTPPGIGSATGGQ